MNLFTSLRGFVLPGLCACLPLAAQEPEFAPPLEEVVYTHEIIDGSFEGPQYLSRLLNSPDDPGPPISWLWDPMVALNTPNLQPGVGGINATAQHGLHYAGMLVKTERDDGLVVGESFAAPLYFQQDSPQFLLLHLASSRQAFIGWIPPDRPSRGGRLRLLIRKSTYSPNLSDTLSGEIWVSPPITGRTWQPQIINFQSPVPKGFLIFQAWPLNDSIETIRYSDILVDNVRGPYPGWLGPFSLGPDRQICLGDTLWLEVDPRNPDIRVSWQDGTLATRYPVTQSGTYRATISFQGYQFSDEIVVNVDTPVELELGRDSVVCLQSELQIGPEAPGYSIKWADGWTASPRLVDRSMNYAVEITNGICTLRDSVYLAVRSCDEIVEVPNVFTPNGDGINDFFGADRAENIRVFQLEIFDRWGRQVAILNRPEQRWDGLDRGQRPAASGVYFWALQYQGFASEEIRALKGSVTLLR